MRLKFAMTVEDAFKDLALDHFTNRPGVTRIETSIIFDARRRHDLPMLLSPK